MSARNYTALEVEDSLLGLLANRYATPDDFADLVCPDDWSLPEHRAIWDAVVKVFASGGAPTDYLRLRREGGLTDDLVKAYMATIERTGIFSVAAVRRAWVDVRRRRRVGELLGRAADTWRANPDVDAVKMAETLSSKLDAVLRDDDLVTDDLDRHCDEALASRKPAAAGLAYPWPGWSRLFGPTRPGQLYSVVGETGKGKTTLIANLVAYWTMALREPVAVFTTETSGGAYLRLLACIQGGISHDPDEDDSAFASAIRDTWRPLRAEGSLIINAYARPSADLLLAQLRRYRARGIQLFVIDHGHQVAFPRGMEGWEALERFAGDLHAFAQNEDAALWVAWQPRKLPSGERGSPDGHLGLDSIKGGQLIAALSARVFNPFQRPTKMLDEDEQRMEEMRAAMVRDSEFLVACLKDRDHGPHKAVRLHLDPVTKRLTDAQGAPFARAQDGAS
jgi:hypothetical protein